ncbi:MAG: hypothetical protein ACREH4_06495 [Vitreimonas sp.]
MAEDREDWLRRSPVAIKLLYFFGAIALLTIGLRLFGAFLRNSPTLPMLFSWADARYFVAMWALFAGAYYLGWLLWVVIKRVRKRAGD